MEWITKNPFELVNPVKEDNKTERYYFSEDEITMILDNADNYFDFYSILYHTGLRATDDVIRTKHSQFNSCQEVHS